MSAHELCRGHKRLLPLIELALDESGEVSRTGGGHLKFPRAGLPMIFTSSTVSDYRAWAWLRRATRDLPRGAHG